MNKIVPIAFGAGALALLIAGRKQRGKNSTSALSIETTSDDDSIDPITPPTSEAHNNPASPTDENIDMDQSGEILVFEADWCTFCQDAKPKIIEIKSRYPDVKFIFINFDKDKKLASEYKIENLPTIVARIDGIEVDRFVGLGTVDEIEGVVKSASEPALSGSNEMRALPPVE